jgi:hypothetical protein
LIKLKLTDEEEELKQKNSSIESTLTQFDFQVLIKRHKNLKMKSYVLNKAWWTKLKPTNLLSQRNR